MNLSDLIRGKPLSVAVATATPATSATHPQERARTVATVATVAVANPAEASSDAWPAWRLHQAEGEPLDVSFCPPATRAYALERYPHAIDAEPIPERPRRVATETEARELRGLIEAVYGGETEADRAETLDAALNDTAAALRCYRAITKGEATRRGSHELE